MIEEKVRRVYVHVSWDKFEGMVHKLASDIKKSKIHFDGLYGIPRGGLPIAVRMSHLLHLPVLLYPTQKSLVVDDISDKGYTLERIKNRRIATLYSTDWTVTQPDWYADKKTSRNHWLVFPWEEK